MASSSAASRLGDSLSRNVSTINLEQCNIQRVDNGDDPRSVLFFKDQNDVPYALQLFDSGRIRYVVNGVTKLSMP